MSKPISASCPPALPSTAARPARLVSIDALRGFDMSWIMGSENIFREWARASNSRYRPFVERQLEHVPWEGFVFYDLIYPLFLFIVGVVLPWSSARTDAGADVRAQHWRIARRVGLLFLLGLINNDLLQMDWSNLRIAGVLQRIAICYGAAALIVLHTSWQTQVKIVLAILLGYWAVLGFIAPPGGTAGDLSPEGNLAGWLDRNYLPGKILPEYYGHGDNEGYLSTIPSVATVLLGALAGRWLKSPRPWGQLVLGLATAGIACVALGLAWGQVFPIIKNIWTSSFVLLAGGLSLLLLAFFYGVIDGLGWKAWAFPFIVIGSNAIFIYVVPGLVPFDATARALFGGIARHAGNWGPFLLVTATFGLQWLALWFLYRKRWFLRV